MKFDFEKFDHYRRECYRAQQEIENNLRDAQAEPIAVLRRWLTLISTWDEPVAYAMRNEDALDGPSYELAIIGRGRHLQEGALVLGGLSTSQDHRGAVWFEHECSLSWEQGGHSDSVVYLSVAAFEDFDEWVAPIVVEYQRRVDRAATLAAERARSVAVRQLAELKASFPDLVEA